MQVLASDLDDISKETQDNLEIAGLLKKETEIFVKTIFTCAVALRLIMHI